MAHGTVSSMMTGIVFLLPLIAAAAAAVLLIQHSARRRARRLLAGRRSLRDREFGELFPPEQAEVAVKLRALLARHVPVDISAVRPYDKPVADLGMDDLDSMSVAELLMEIEDALGVKLSDDEAQQAQTFGDLVRTVAANARR